MNRAHTVFSVIAITSVAACTDIRTVRTPEVTKDEFVYVSDLLYTVECELADAKGTLNSIGGRPLPNPIGVTYDLTVMDATGVGGAAKLVIPIGPSQLQIDTGLTPTATGTRLFNFSVPYPVASLRPCTDAAPNQDGGNPHERIAGGLGIAEWANELRSTFSQRAQKPTNTNYTVTFEIAKKRNVGATFTAQSTDSVTTSLDGTRKLTHKISLIANYVPPKESEAPEQTIQRLFDVQDSFLERTSQ